MRFVSIISVCEKEEQKNKEVDMKTIKPNHNHRKEHYNPLIKHTKKGESIMKQLFKSKLIYRQLAALMALVLLFGCSQDLTDPVSAVTPIQSAASRAQLAFNKEATATAIIQESVIAPLGGRIKINGKNINEANFQIKPGNFADSTYMQLIKLSETSNSYHLKPFGLNLPESVAITLGYSHSALPNGVSETDLQVFQLVGEDYIALTSRVKTNHMEVNAQAYSSGEFALGAYDNHGTLHLIEGEYGLRAEDRIGKNGGTINLGGGSKIEIPKGALDDRTNIGLIATRETLNGSSAAKGFTFTPHGTVFNKPILLELSWKELAGQVVELNYYNELTGEWEKTSQGSWDERNHTVTLEVHHFSRYAIAFSR